MVNPQDQPEIPAELDEEWTPFREMAVAFHEMYESFVWAGFTEDQAIRLVATMAKEGN